jgi:3-oxoacyl-[acyl-carrier-protein] synthase-3
MITVRGAAGSHARLHTIGAYTPSKILTNADFERMVDTSDEWIVTRTGIRERHIAAENETTAALAEACARDILARAGMSGADLDVLIIATATPEHLFPSTACVVQERIGAVNAACYDSLAACSGFVYALAQARAYIESGMARKVLVIGAETLSRITDYTDRTTCVLFGDAAAGALVVASDEPTQGFVGFELGADGSGASQLGLRVGGSACPPHHPHEREDEFLFMNGREVFKFATRVIIDSTQRLLEATGLTMDDIDLFIPHQANTRIIDYAVDKLGVDRAKVMVNVDRYGNTSSASVPLAMVEARDTGRLSPGDRVLMIAFGGGLTWGATIVHYEPEAA